MEFVFGFIILIVSIILLSKYLRKSSSQKQDYNHNKDQTISTQEIDNLIMDKHSGVINKNQKLTLTEAIDKIEIITQNDEFDDTDLTYFNNVTQKDYVYLPMYFEKVTEEIVSYKHIGLTFQIFNNQILLVLYSCVKQMGLAKGDSIKLIFNNSKLDLRLHNNRSSGNISSNSYLLSPEEMRPFVYENLVKWKMISNRRNQFIVGDNTLFHESCEISQKEVAQGIIKYMAKSILKEYINGKNYVTAYNNV